MGVVRATSACDKLCLLYDLLLFLMVSIYLKKKIIIKYTDLILGRIKLMLGMVTITFPSPILYMPIVLTWLLPVSWNTADY